MWKSEHMRLPVHVIGYIEVRIVGPVRVLCVGAPVEDSELAAEVFKLRLPGVFPVIGHIRPSAGLIIHNSRFPVHMEHLVGFPEGNEAFHKVYLILVGLQKLPV